MGDEKPEKIRARCVPIRSEGVARKRATAKPVSPLTAGHVAEHRL